jgi:hypothetical protein
MPPDMKLDEFLRLHALRAPNVAWLLGAGASAAAGIPTAFDMIWDFKRTLFCAAHWRERTGANRPAVAAS